MSPDYMWYFQSIQNRRTVASPSKLSVTFVSFQLENDTNAIAPLYYWSQQIHCLFVGIVRKWQTIYTVSHILQAMLEILSLCSFQNATKNLQCDKIKIFSGIRKAKFWPHSTNSTWITTSTAHIIAKCMVKLIITIGWVNSETLTTNLKMKHSSFESTQKLSNATNYWTA